MTSNEIREKFLKFFEEKGHSIIPSASLIPENDNSVLFTTAGMQPLVPYLLGKPHPKGTRLASTQKCLRTGDIDDIGDNRHLTFFEMLGNWSLGDYFKDESIAWSFEFLTSKEKGLGLDANRLYVTCFEGDESAPRDEESKNIWMKAGIPESRIYFLGKEDNWWGPGENGPCGPDTEIFYDVTGTCGELSQQEFLNAQKEEKIIEIWNNVFMEYESKDGKVVGKLSQKNVDTGMGLERITAVINGKDNVYDTDGFDYIFNLLPNGEERSRRIIADHMRASCFLISDGVTFSPNGQGYVLRRLIRRAAQESMKIKFSHTNFEIIIKNIAEKYVDTYPEILKNETRIISLVNDELSKFGQVISKKTKFIDSLFNAGYSPIVVRDIKNEQDRIVDNPIIVDGSIVFDFEQKEGVPFDILRQWLEESGFWEGSSFLSQYENYLKSRKEHQDKSRAGGEQKFKGGLAGTSEAIVKLHTAHHLLLASLQKVLGPSVKQRGSNITEERLRIDFAFDRKMTDEEKAEVEKLVNEAIEKDYKVIKREMPKDEAEKIGAEMEFGAKYEDIVSVYFIEDENGNAISKEFCGGPHVEHTGILGKFKIQKEEASSAGVRRIKGVLL